MITRLYQWTMELARHRHAPWALGIVSFLESSVFPVPPDAVLIPMVLARRDRAWRYALLCTATSVTGGILGYAIGLFLFDQIGQPLLAFYGYEQQFDRFQATYSAWGPWAVFVAGLTPFPYKVITILSGVAALDPVIFVFSSILARGTRFFLVAGLLWQFGETVQAFIEKHLPLLTILFCILLIGGFVSARFLF